MSEEAWSETQYELQKRVVTISERRGFLPDEQAALLFSATSELSTCLNVIPSEAYIPFRTAALGRIPQDPDDWPSVALALALEAGIWTEDRDFFGSGLATWRTPVLQVVLETELRYKYTCKETKVEKAVVTRKGRITLPKRIRERLSIKAGDKLLFEVEDDGFRVRVMHRRGIDELFAALPGVPVYAGEAAEKEAVRAGFTDFAS